MTSETIIDICNKINVSITNNTYSYVAMYIILLQISGAEMNIKFE